MRINESGDTVTSKPGVKQYLGNGVRALHARSLEEEVVEDRLSLPHDMVGRQRNGSAPK